ncbi:MAG: hypothetical protein ACI9FN_003305 [Saprospiraceae bacterium]|jgi:hypothetical protein
MKKVIIILISVAFIASMTNTMNAAAVAPASIYVTKSSEAKKIVLNFENMFADKVKCTFLSQTNGIIFSDVIYTSERKSKKYDLSKLPIGNYVVEVNDLMKIEKLSFSITKEGVEFANEESQITYKPTVWLNEDNTVDFNLLALQSDVSISISNSEEVLLKEDILGENSIGRRYNLSKYVGQDITVNVYHAGEGFVYTLSL